MKLFAKNRKGFTLTELMVVVVILGILVAIAIPVYNGLDAKAKKAADETNIRTIQSVVLQFCMGENIDQTKITITAAYNPESKAFDLTIKEGTEAVNKTIVPIYIEKWPASPYDDQSSYNVTGTTTGITVAPQYSGS